MEPSSDDLVTELIEENFGRYSGSLSRSTFACSFSRSLMLSTHCICACRAAFWFWTRPCLPWEGVVSQLCPDLNLFDIARRLSGTSSGSLPTPQGGSSRPDPGRRVRSDARRLPVLLRDLMEEMRGGSWRSSTATQDWRM